jgi:exodeoxyribonuclease VIII
MSPINAVVIDFETLSTDNAAVVPSVAAVFGDLRTGVITERLHLRLNVQAQVQQGYLIDASTLEFWMKQDAAARGYMSQILAGKGVIARDNAFRQLYAFIDRLPKGTRVFGNGPTFDLGICHKEWGVNNLPWDFWDERCVRSWDDLLRVFTNEKSADRVPFRGVKHNPLDDCEHEFARMAYVVSYFSQYITPASVANYNNEYHAKFAAPAPVQEEFPVYELAVKSVDEATASVSSFVPDEYIDENAIEAEIMDIPLGENYAKLAAEFAKDEEL